MMPPELGSESFDVSSVFARPGVSRGKPRSGAGIEERRIGDPDSQFSDAR
jgi:hypothetical protein